jgi:sucrose phosphorylase
MRLANKVQLITYADSLGHNLQELDQVLNKYFSKAIGGIHILPFYPSSADRGFCPLTYEKVNPLFGSWQDIDILAKKYDLTFDFIPNHISYLSIYFQDYLKNGTDSKWRNLFLQIEKVYQSSQIPKDQLAKIALRKPSAPELKVEFTNKNKEITDKDSKNYEYIWQTFESKHQIDLDTTSQTYKELYGSFLNTLINHGAKMIRLDALAFITKKKDTSCFFIEPDIWQFTNWIEKIVDSRACLLPELHEDFKYQEKIAKQGYYIYDFVLPLMTLHALYENTSHNLKMWLKDDNNQKKKRITTLDTHDGIPVKDCYGIMQNDEIERTWQTLEKYGANISYNHLTDGTKEVYQMNCTYYSALSCNDKAYLLARLIQLFTPGIPQIYYTGLLAGKNDIELLNQFQGEKVGSWGRDINRHNYSLEEIDTEMKKPVIQELLQYLQFRNNHPAFDGTISVNQDSQDHILQVKWTNNDVFCQLEANLKTYDFLITTEKGAVN